MTRFKTLKTSVCLTALFSASSAMADVTAVDVWENWKDNLAIYGDDGVSVGAEVISDGVVTVSDMSLSMAEDGTSVEADLGTLVFKELGDGTVSVTMAESYPITIVPEDGGLVRVNVLNTGLSMIVSGDKENMNYDVSADRYAIEVVEIVENGASVIDGDILIAANNLTGQYNVRTDDLRHIDYDVAIGSLDMLFDVKDPDSEEMVLISGKLDALTAKSQIAMPLEIDADAPEDIFGNGLAIDGNTTFDAANYIFDVDADGDRANGSVSLGAGAIGFAMNNNAMSYEVGTRDIALDLQVPDLPFPVDVSLAEYGIGFAMPLSATEEPAPFGLKINLTGLAVNDEIWSMGDPGQILPRDPITMNLDLSGQAKLFFDLMDPEQAAAMELATVPGELTALNLNDLLLSAGGALVTGSGAFTFDNSDLETFNGMPRPLGDATVKISGANGLIDNLVSMGLLPEDQASMGRLMMGMFARSTGDDQLETIVEINDQGHLIVNGQRMQ